MSDFEETLNTLLSNPDSMAQIMKMAQSFTGGSESNSSSPPPPHQQTASSTSGGGGATTSTPEGSVASLFSGLDPKLIARFLPLLQQMNQSDGRARQLLFALRPYLKPDRQEKVERALQIAKIISLGKNFLSSWEG